MHDTVVPIKYRVWLFVHYLIIMWYILYTLRAYTRGWGDSGDRPPLEFLNMFHV